MSRMKLNSASLPWILGFTLNLLCIIGLASSGAISRDADEGTPPLIQGNLGAVDKPPTTEIHVHVTVQPATELSTEPLTTAFPDETATPLEPTEQDLTTQAKEETTTPPLHTTRKAPGTTMHQPSKQPSRPKSQKPTKPPAAMAPEKRDEVETTTEAYVSTLPPTTVMSMQAPASTTTERTTTTRAPTTRAKITTQKLNPVVTSPKKPTEPNVVPTTRLVTSRVPITEGHQPVKTDGNQPTKTTEKHTVTSKPDTGTDESGSGKANNSVFSKLMLPVVLGIVAAILIICFAYGIRACKKKDRSQSRSKMMHNGKDHEMGGNFDRMKLLADSSEDEF